MSCLWAAPVCLCVVRDSHFAILVPSPLRIPLCLLL